MVYVAPDVAEAQGLRVQETIEKETIHSRVAEVCVTSYWQHCGCALRPLQFYRYPWFDCCVPLSPHTV